MSLVKRLAYVEIEASDLERWTVFGRDVFGCELAAGSTADCLQFRIDARPWRIQVSRGTRDDLKVIGLEVADRAGLHDRQADAEQHDAEPQDAHHAELDARAQHLGQLEQVVDQDAEQDRHHDAADGALLQAERRGDDPGEVLTCEGEEQGEQESPEGVHAGVSASSCS